MQSQGADPEGRNNDSPTAGGRCSMAWWTGGSGGSSWAHQVSLRAATLTAGLLTVLRDTVVTVGLGVPGEGTVSAGEGVVCWV